MPVSLLWHDVNVLIYHGGFLTTTFDLVVDGDKELVIPRDYQMDPVTDRPLHVDFLRIKKGSKIDVEIPVRAINEEEAVGLTRVVPFLVEDELAPNGGLYAKGADWAPFVVTDGLLVTGQNPASSGPAAETLVARLANR